MAAGGPAGPDRIEVRGLTVLGVHGVLAEERRRAQPFELDVDIELDTVPAARSDELADTVDYGTLVQAMADLVTTRSFRLLEALAGAVAGQVLEADGRIAGVTVTVRKLRPPVPLDVATVGVRVTRRRPGPGG